MGLASRSGAVAGRWAGALCSGALAWLAPGAASGAPEEPASEPIRIVFNAPTDCSDSAVFSGQLFARTARGRLAGDNEVARRFEVSITPVKGHVEGLLRIATPTGEESLRGVKGATCAEVVAALALISALAVDPQAKTAPAEALLVGPSPPPPPPVPPPPVVSPPPPHPVEPIGGSPVPSSEGAPLNGRRNVPPGNSVWSVGLGGDGHGGISPGFQGLVASLFLGVASPTSEFRVSLGMTASVPSSAGLGLVAQYQWFGGTVDACAYRFRLGSDALGLRPCARLEIGVLRGEGELPADNLQAINRPWLSAGLFARLDLHVTRNVFVELQGGALVDFQQDTFVFDPGIQSFKVPAIAGFEGLHVGYSFL